MRGEKEERGPSGQDVHWWTVKQSVYVLGDLLLCCGCAYHSGPEMSACECRCHHSSRLTIR